MIKKIFATVVLIFLVFLLIFFITERSDEKTDKTKNGPLATEEDEKPEKKITEEDKKIIEAIFQKGKSISSLKYNVIITDSFGSKLDFTFWESSKKIRAEQETNRGREVFIIDPEKNYSYLVSPSNMIAIQMPKREEDMIIESSVLANTSFFKNATPLSVTKDNINEKEYYLIRYKERESKVQLCKETGLVVGVKYKKPEREVRVEVKNIEITPNIPDHLFHLPSNVEVTDHFLY